MEEGGGLFNLLPLDAIQCILSHLSPWDLICVAPRVCRTWAQVCRRAQLRDLWPSYVQRRMAWLVWRNVLQEGPFTQLMRKSLPAPCMRRNYAQEVHRYIQKRWSVHPNDFRLIFSDAFPSEPISNLYALGIEGSNIFGAKITKNGDGGQFQCMWRRLIKEFAPSFWSECSPICFNDSNGTATVFTLVPLYAIYEYFIAVLEFDYGIRVTELCSSVKDELETGPEREAKRNRMVKQLL